MKETKLTEMAKTTMSSRSSYKEQAGMRILLKTCLKFEGSTVKTAGENMFSSEEFFY